MWRCVRSLTEVTSAPDLIVYDFKVDEDETFCIPGVVLHNCPGWSQAAQPARKANPLVREAHNALRSNVWAVVACVEAKLPQAFIVENVVDLKKWPLLPVWREAFRVLGYSMEQHELCASHFGVPQRRTRLFIVGVRSASPLGLVFPRSNTEEPIGPYLDLDEGTWTPIADATPQVKARIAKARARGLGEVFLTQHVTGHPGVPLHEPMRTITTKDQWAIVRGDEYRPLSVRENARGMGFPDGYQWPSKATRGDQILGLGNAVAPPLAWRLISEVQRHL